MELAARHSLFWTLSLSYKKLQRGDSHAHQLSIDSLTPFYR